MVKVAASFLINGKIGQISPFDRALLYGDAIFRTFIVEHKRPTFWKYHYRKIVEDCRAIKIKAPTEKDILDGIGKLFGRKKSVARVIVSRGGISLGYRVDKKLKPNLIILKSNMPKVNKEVDLFLCKMRLSKSNIGSIKHSNRLENVMARLEWNDEYDDGLLLDIKGHVIECVSSNIFIRYGRRVYTPKLNDIGVRGVMRNIVIDRLPLIGYTIKEKNLDLNKLLHADEIFITNSVSGIRFVKSIKGQTWRDDQLTSLLHKHIGI